MKSLKGLLVLFYIFAAFFFSFCFEAPALCQEGHVQILLLDALSGQPLSGIKVVARRVLRNGKTKWVKSGETDSNGLLGLDLEGLGQGASYIFSARVFNNITSYSRKVSGPGTVTFQVGKVKALLINGADGTPLPDYKVTLKELKGDGKYRWVASGKTDKDGIIRFDPKGLGTGKEYVLAAKSPQDGSYKFSQRISSRGVYTFRVGNTPLVIRVINGLSGEPLPGIKVTATRIEENGKRKWVSSHEADSNGTVIFDLNGLGQGATYRLYCKPYNGGTVYSTDITRPGLFEFKVGLIPVHLVNRQTGNAIGGVKLVLYKLKDDNKLKWVKSGKTDDSGYVIFDAADLGTGCRYVVRAEKPFGDKKRYYSPWIKGPGPVEFEIDSSRDYSLDLAPPWIGFSGLTNGQKVPSSGFMVSGTVTDNQEVRSVELYIEDASHQMHRIETHLDQRAFSWQAKVAGALLKASGPLKLSAIAYDRVLNSSNATLNLSVVSDVSAPSVTLALPSGGSGLERSGFVLSGNITEETEVSRVNVSLSCPGEHKSGVSKKALVDLHVGKWMAAFRREELPSCADINVSVSAVDTSGNGADYQFRVSTFQSALNPFQLINRITFGATPALLFKVLQEGAETFLQSQLHPSSIDDSWFESQYGSFVPEKKYDLIRLQLLRSISSKRQLLEVMTWFWENHFNTDITRHYHIEYELRENELFRKHALGKFRDLLEISAKSPAMLYYLDNVSNQKESPNENYAREIMELHTLGVDNGYTQEDIVQVARCFTGWRVKDGAFYFDPRRHDYGEKRVLGHTIAAGRGVEDGLEVLDILASHPNTARFICRKLAVYLVDDHPSSGLVERCATIFRATDGDIGEIVTMLLHSEEFNDPQNFHNKVKNPLEFVCGFVRNLGAQPSMEHIRRTLDILGMRPFFYPQPTGWPEKGAKWVNSEQYLQRIRFVSQSVFNENKDKYCKVNMKGFFTDAGITTPEEIVQYLLEIALSGDYTDQEKHEALELLNRGTTDGFNMDMPDAERRLRELAILVLSFPQYQLQ